MTRKVNRTGNLKKVLRAVLVLGPLGGLAGLGVYSAFTATTDNSNNTITSGTVVIGQHSGSTTLYSVTNQAGGDATSACLRATYTGSITASAVKLYVSSGITNGTIFNLKVDRHAHDGNGTDITSPAANMNCTGFVADTGAAGVVYADAALGSFPTTYGAGIDGKDSAATWANTNYVDYKFTITQNDDATPNAHTSATSSGTHTFTWEARS